MQASGLAYTNSIMYSVPNKLSSSRSFIDGASERNQWDFVKRKRVGDKRPFVAEEFSSKQNLSRTCVFITAINDDSFHSSGGIGFSIDKRGTRAKSSKRAVCGRHTVPGAALKLSYERNSSG